MEILTNNTLEDLNEGTNVIYIPGHVPSFKNSKIKTKLGKIIPSKSWSTYQKNSKGYYLQNAIKFRNLVKNLDKPYKIGFFFIRKTNHIFDFHNICAGPLDLMVLYNYLQDDNITEILPYPLKIKDKYYFKDATNPGMYIVVFK
jgi:hypothetical protein